MIARKSGREFFFRRVKDMALLVAAGLVLAFGGPTYENVKNSRAYRDMAGLSAAKDIEVKRAIISTDGMTITVWGVLTKMGCEKAKGSDSASTLGPDGLWHYAFFDPSKEPPRTPESRPPLGQPDAFGPWSITSYVANPQRAAFWVNHLACPDKGYPLRVFDIPWKEIK